MRRCIAAVATAGLLLIGGCSEDDGDSAGDCTNQVEFQETTYLGYAYGDAELKRGVAGEGFELDCIDDGSDTEPGRTPIEVLAVTDGTGDVIAVDRGAMGLELLFRSDLPDAEQERLISELTGPRG